MAGPEAETKTLDTVTVTGKSDIPAEDRQERKAMVAMAAHSPDVIRDLVGKLGLGMNTPESLHALACGMQKGADATVEGKGIEVDGSKVSADRLTYLLDTQSTMMMTAGSKLADQQLVNTKAVLNQVGQGPERTEAEKGVKDAEATVKLYQQGCAPSSISSPKM